LGGHLPAFFYFSHPAAKKSSGVRFAAVSTSAPDVAFGHDRCLYLTVTQLPQKECFSFFLPDCIK
jgi:hypothetical protein